MGDPLRRIAWCTAAWEVLDWWPHVLGDRATHRAGLRRCQRARHRARAARPRPTGRRVFPAGCRRLVAEAKQVVLLVLDGLGWDQLQERPDVAPTIFGHAGFGSITTVAPTTTATALSSIATGLTPGEHGLIGYRIVLGGEVRQRPALGGRRRGSASIAATRGRAAVSRPFSARSDSGGQPGRTHRSSAFTAGPSCAARVSVGWRATSSMPVEVRRQLEPPANASSTPTTAASTRSHTNVVSVSSTTRSCATADRLVGDLLDVLPPGAVLLVTADHGQVEVGDNIVHPSDDLLRHGDAAIGRGSVPLVPHASATRWMICAPLRHRGVRCDTGWVRTREELIGEGWFGPSVSPPVAVATRRSRRDRACEPVSYHDPGRRRTVRARLSPRIDDVCGSERAAAGGNAKLTALGVVRGRGSAMTDADHDHHPHRQTVRRRTAAPAAVEHGELLPPVDAAPRCASPEPPPNERGSVTEPAKVMRIGSMVKQLLDEVRQAPLDEAQSRERLAEVYERSVTEVVRGAVARPPRRTPDRWRCRSRTTSCRATASSGWRRLSSSGGSKACSTASRRRCSHSSWRRASSSNRCASSHRDPVARRRG